ncbi:serine hydrolase [Saccharomonospora saliphila]|uniref:serine hydrolase n=1 Tax=Saccharomonospora saliphila TaxID=369829 RepID=UPI0006622663|nr:serine hydrolase [Saccharomonospora saliphila]
MRPKGTAPRRTPGWISGLPTSRSRAARVTALVAVLVLTGVTAMAAVESGSGRFDRPRPGFSPASTVLREAEPERAGLDPEPLRAAERRLEGWTAPDAVDGHPLFSGAVGLLAHDGMVVDTHAAGDAVRYADGEGTELPPEERVPMREDTVFDIASITKLFTSVAVMRLVERFPVSLDDPVARHLPEFGAHGKDAITVRQLLTHTSGLQPTLPLWREHPDVPSRIRAVLEVPPRTEPGTDYAYSDLNLITLGVLVERVTGDPLDAVIAEWITGPLGMTDTGFNPGPAQRHRIAATEFQREPDRGMVHGEVHDENAWALGGVAGHAGLFSTARDLAVLAQALLNGGTYDGERILRPDSVRALFTDYNSDFPGHAHGLGFELDQLWYMGGLTSPATAGHTGYTGTSLVIDPLSRSVAVLLTNRVHPSREWGSVNPARQTWATALARALAVEPVRGTHAWFSGAGDAESATLGTPALSPRGSGSVEFRTFVHSESSDRLVLEARTEDDPTWRALPMRAHGRGAPEGTVRALSGTAERAWWSVRAPLPRADALTLRWRFTTDGNYTGRGVLVDGVRVRDERGTVLDAERDPERLDADGFVLRDR